jgi:GntR family histidine utilization transcriptional repressor
LINRVHGIGSFVAERPRHASLIELQDIALEIARDGKQHRSWILHQGIIAADALIATQLELPVDSVVFHLSAVHYQDELPIQLESRYVNPATMPDFMEQDFNQITATAYLLEQFKPDEMEHRVSAMMPDSATCELLAMHGGQPCLQLTRRTWHQQQVVTYVTLTYPGDRYELGARYATNEFQLR